MPDLRYGQIVWVNLSPVVGSEQAGHRPAVVICGNDYLATVPNIVIVVPVTTRDRGLPNHVRLDAVPGLARVPSFAMTEQPRALDRRRITKVGGMVDEETMASVRVWLRDFLGWSGDR